MKIVIVSGYFDPLHIGHLELFKKAKKLGDELWVIVNNNKQVKLKKKKPFMSQDERLKIIQSVDIVNRVFLSKDKDASVCKTLKYLFSLISLGHPVIFANGGDVNAANCRERELCKELGIIDVYGLGDKIQSSSWLTKKK